jgi:sterol 3beta-glucosyltransferase
METVTPIEHTNSFDDDDDSLNDMSPPSISQIYTDAARYNKVLVQGGCTRRSSTDSDPGTANLEGVTNLIGRALEGATKDNASDQLVKLSVAGDTFTPTELTEEPESYDDDTESTEDQSIDQSIDLEVTPEGASTPDSESWKLSPVEIVDLLVQEFGPLADQADPEDCEELISETDVGLFQDVVILVCIFL